MRCTVHTMLLGPLALRTFTPYATLTAGIGRGLVAPPDADAFNPPVAPADVADDTSSGWEWPAGRVRGVEGRGGGKVAGSTAASEASALWSSEGVALKGISGTGGERRRRGKDCTAADTAADAAAAQEDPHCSPSLLTSLLTSAWAGSTWLFLAAPKSLPPP